MITGWRSSACPRSAGPRPGSSSGSATAPPIRTSPTPPRSRPGLDGVKRELELPEPVEGMIYDLPDEALGDMLPTTFAEALTALKEDQVMVDALGPRLVETFETIKMAELERFRAWVTDWEFEEYSKLL